MTDTTAPAPQSTHFRIVALAVPAILANFSAVLPNLVDTALVGQTGDATALGGISVGAALAALVLWAFAFLRLGTAGFTAQAFGAEDGDEIKATLNRALSLAWIFGCVVLLVMVPLAYVTVPLFGSSEAVADLAARYFHYRLFSAPFDFTNYVILGWLIGLQRMGRALALQLLLNGLNIALCYILVFRFHLGVDGAAIATAIAQTVTAIVGFVVVRRLLRIVPLSDDAGSLIDLDKLFVLISVNFDIFLRTLAIMFIMAYFVGLGARMGDATVAANQVLFVLLAAIAQTFDGCAQSTETLVGQAVGARDRRQLRNVVWGSLLWTLLIAAAFSALLYRFGPTIIGVFSSDPPVVALASPYLPWLVATPLVAFWCYTLDGVFIGATRGREMRNGMIIAGLGAIIAQYFLIPAFGNHGLWASLMLFFGLRAATLYLWYPRIPRALAH
ncbi:MAG: MATE family efflux transporter [Rhodospirillaceae bacterium]|nr:MATE family efflux transporter [Rhodospirillaceae bacterium]